MASVVFGEFAAVWPAPASSRYAFSEAAGMLLKNGIEWFGTGATLSFEVSTAVPLGWCVILWALAAFTAPLSASMTVTY